MGKVCVVKNCGNSQGGAAKLHEFKNDPERIAKWLLAIEENGGLRLSRGKPIKITNSSVVCGAHFTADCYGNGVITATGRLKDAAIPTIFQPVSDVSLTPAKKIRNGIINTIISLLQRYMQ